MLTRLNSCAKLLGHLRICAVQGALLLVLFQVSHTVEHMLTSRATGDLRALFEVLKPSSAACCFSPMSATSTVSCTQSAHCRKAVKCHWYCSLSRIRQVQCTWTVRRAGHSIQLAGIACTHAHSALPGVGHP